MTSADNYLSQPEMLVLQNDAIGAGHVPLHSSSVRIPQTRSSYCFHGPLVIDVAVVA